MQVRLAYSIAIQVDFDILLLDEVLAVGDQEFQERASRRFRRSERPARRSCSSPTISDAIEEHCDRAMLLVDGRIQALGRPDDVLNRYGAIVHHVAEAVP